MRIEKETDRAEWVGEVNADRKWIKAIVEAIKGEISRIPKTLSEIVGQMLEGALTQSSRLQLIDANCSSTIVRSGKTR